MKLESDRYTTGEKALSQEEYDKLLSVITDLQDEVLIRLGVATGIRREDIVQIKVNNIDEREKSLLFHEAKKDKREKVPYVEGKKKPKGKVLKEEWRTISLPDSIIVLIKKFEGTWTPDERKKRVYLFDYSGKTAYRHLIYWCKVAGINSRPFHALRATCVKFAKKSGWTDPEISALTGDLISTLQRHYQTPSVGEMKEVTRDKPFV